MRFIESICLAFVLDLLIGDPTWIPHPVVLMGKCITALEHFLRPRFPQTPKGEQAAGRVVAVVLPVVTFALTAGILYGAYRLHPVAAFVLHTFWCAQALAVKDMLKESRNVAREVSLADTLANARSMMGENLVGDVVPIEEQEEPQRSKSKRSKRKSKKKGRKAAKKHAGSESANTRDDLIWNNARSAVGRIVGRDTAALDKAGIIRATVETVAENFSDGVVAPLFYMVIGGAPLALAYKAVNTMDSMIGYKNKKYLHFGSAAAKLDDRANFLPSRLAALFLILSARICQGSEAAKRAFKIWKRDRLKHPSPNSAQTESVMAGALGVRLLGPTSYFGKLYKKEWIGDSLREVETKDIAKACHMFLVGSFVALIFLLGARGLCAAAVRYVPILFRRIVG